MANRFPPARERITVTVSDLFGARYFSFTRAAKRRFFLALLIVAPLMAASLPYNYVQFQQRNVLHSENARLDELYANLKQHTARKEQLYAAVRDRVELLEWTLGPQENPNAPTPADIAARVDAVAYHVLQEKIMRTNIPNGYPTHSRVITSRFGDRIHPVTRRKAFHHGIDLRAKRAEVYATADGIVRAADYSKLGGNRVIIQHNFGFETYYAHLHKMHVKRGEVIQKGQLVGISGDSGRHSTGPHLHYEIRYLGKSVNPVEFLKWEFGSNDIFTQVKAIQWQSLIKLINDQITHPTLQLSQTGAASAAK